MNTIVKSNFENNSIAEHRTFNKLGLFLSVLCAFHCLLTPVLFVFIPLTAKYINNDVFHVVMVLMALPVAILSTKNTLGFKKSSNILMYVGIIFLLLGVYAHFSHSSHSDPHDTFHLLLENSLTIFGGILLFIAHYKRLKHCRCTHTERV